MSELFQVQLLGLDEGSDPKSVPPGTLLRAENVQMDKFRRLRKRDGTASFVKTLLAGGSVAAGKRLLLRGDDVTVDDGTEAQSYIAPVTRWKPLSRPPVWSVTSRPIADSTYSVQMLDSAVSGDFLISAYMTYGVGGSSGAVYYQIENLATGAQILAPTYVTSIISLGSNGVRVLANATHAYVVGSTLTDYVAIKISLTTLAVVSTTTLVAGTGIGNAFDACLGTATAGASLYLAYEESAGVNRTTIASFVLSTMAAGVTAAFLGTGVSAIDIVASATNVYLAYSTSAPITNIVSTDQDLATIAGPTSLGAFLAHSVFVGNISASSYLVGYTRSDATGASLSANRLITAAYATATNVVTAATTRQTWGVFRANKPWKTGTRWYVAVTALTIPYVAASTASFPQASIVVVEIELADTLTGIQNSTHPVAAVLENQTGWYAQSSLLNSSPGIDSAGNVWMATSMRSREPGTRSEVIPISWNICRLTTSGTDARRSAEAGGGALLSGGVPLWNDGASLHPYGFIQAPLIVSATATAGGAMVAGIYSYIVVFVWRDFNGVLHRSTPSPPLSGTTAGGNLSLTLVISTSCLAPKRTTTAAEPPPVFIEIYRTIIGGAGDHYRLSQEPAYNSLFNLTTAGDVTFVDTRADADITGNVPTLTLASRAKLYTETGELADEPPSAFVTCTTHRGRLVGLRPDLRTLSFTKDSTQDVTVAPGFNEALTLAFAADKSAFASLDEKLVVFGEDSIDIVHGDGPDATGQNNTWQIQRVQTDVGCVNPRSVVACPLGVVFETSRGLELLDRGLNITWIGRNVEDTLASFPTITSAVLVPDKEEIRFTCNATGGATGVVVIYDYTAKAWFTRKYTDLADTSTASVAFVDAALINGVYTMLTAGGQVYQESSSTKLENGTGFVAIDVVVAPVSPAGNLAWTRLKDVTLLGTSVTNHDLKVSVARNYATSYEQDNTFLAGSLATVVGPLEKCRITMKTQKCHAIQVRIQDITPTTPGTYPVSTGDGPILEALAFRVSKRPGVAKTAAGQQG